MNEWMLDEPTGEMCSTPAGRYGRIEVVETGEWAAVTHERLFIGRSPRCGLVLKDTSVSGIHAEIVATPRGVRLADLGSVNGTFLGPARLGGMYLHRPAEFSCGRVRLAFSPVVAPERVADLAPDAYSAFGEMIGISPGMRSALEQLCKCASSDQPVLIAGETGTGKSLAARALHEASARREEKVVTIHCAAFDAPGQLEAELFGYRRGAFTGALEDFRGAFVEANGGTLVLDQVKEMSLEMQTALLRVLDTQRVRPIGGEERQVNVRVIAAADMDLEAKVEDHAFREDLYVRLLQRSVVLPPLRHRLEDVPLLLARLGPEVQLGGAAIAELQARDWPGNVRELEWVIERAKVETNGQLVSREDALTAAPLEGDDEASPQQRWRRMADWYRVRAH